MSDDQQHRLQCMNVWGGNQSTNTSLTTAGLDIWVFSSPYQNAESGGDIYQISSCSSGSISRLLLADVSGHGIIVSDIAKKLRSIMHKHISEICQKKLVSEINREFTLWEDSDAFATAVICTFFAPSRKLSLSNAGHPTPLIYSGKTRKWTFHTPLENEYQRNFPLGILPENAFNTFETSLTKGDMLLLFTDAFPESKNELGLQLNEAGILELINSLPLTKPDNFLNDLVVNIKSKHPDNLLNDDATLILIKANGSQGRLQDFAAAPYRLIKNIFAPKRYA
jgi:serine phosphatase RsbU (regulator of sigma subunit)